MRIVERGMKSIGFASGRNGRSPLDSPSPAMLWIGLFCSSRPLALSTMLYLNSMPQRRAIALCAIWLGQRGRILRSVSSQCMTACAGVGVPRDSVGRRELGSRQRRAMKL